MPAYYFINQSGQDQELELQFRNATKSFPERPRLEIYEIISKAIPHFVPTRFEALPDCIAAHQRSCRIIFPAPVPLVKLSHIIFGYEELLQRKYCLPGFVEVEPGDIVIDCGAYVGGFSLSACKTAHWVHAFEPDEENFRCLASNFEQVPNVIPNQAGLYSESKTMTLNISASSVEHSLLAPDDGPPIATQTIVVRSLSDYCSEKGIDHIDFCKIEAEGVELEVFDGLGGMLPRKLAIDVSPERNGESPAPEFIKRLELLGYQVQQRRNVLFARLPGSEEEERKRDFPRVIYSLWMQGRENAPDIVKYNLNRWEELNPDYKLEVLDALAVEHLLREEDLAIGGISIQSLSDVVRMKLLSERGGIWVDASVLPVVPLDNWLPAAMRFKEFFAFERNDVPLSSWFLCATPASLITKAWWAEIARVWSSSRVVSSEPVIPENPEALVSSEALEASADIPYFWVHCLFHHMLEHQPEVFDIWERRTKKPSSACHDLQNLFTESANPTDEQIRYAMRAAPVQKLNWRFAYPVYRLAQSITTLQRNAAAEPVSGGFLAKLKRSFSG